MTIFVSIYLDKCHIICYIIFQMEVNMTQRPAQELQNSSVKRERFVRIAERRVNRVLDSLENLSKCSSRRNYDYKDEDVYKIFREIERKLKEVKFQFQAKGEKRKRFSL